ncbi:hypothetical protein PTKIN_Ptkin05aG0017700 [Pterospermum kingtungense]
MAKRDQKKVKNDEEEAPKDRLSDLPNCLLLHFRSFLPQTKWSVRIRVLSKRWKSFWASLPVLIFHGRGDLPSYKKFVCKVLSGHNNLSLRKLCLHYPGEISPSSLESSYLNRIEELCCSWSEIGVITPYEGQRTCIVNYTSRNGALMRRQLFKEIEVMHGFEF